MSDLIDRQAAIEAIEQMQMPIMRSEFPEEQFVFTGMSEALQAIKDLPSAPPKKVCVAEIKVDIDDLKDYIDKAINAERWIPCSERLPKGFQTCIVTDELRQCSYEYDYNPDNEFTKRYGWRYNGRKIVAWMPLPEPYKGEQE